MWLIVCLSDCFHLFYGPAGRRTHSTSTLRAGGFITWLSALVLARTDLVNTSNNWISRGFCTLERHERSKNWHFNYSSQHWFVPTAAESIVFSHRTNQRKRPKHLVYRKQLLNSTSRFIYTTESTDREDFKSNAAITITIMGLEIWTKNILDILQLGE